MIHRRDFLLAASAAIGVRAEEAPRKRVRDWGIRVGHLSTGQWNAITDVAGVRVGHATLREGANVRTGVTVVLPHSGNLFREKVRGAVMVGNGFGKLMGSTQVNELGEIESPIALTSTLNVARVADGLLDYLLELSGNEGVRSLNVLVGETNDGRLNDIRARRVGSKHVSEAINAATSGRVPEGCVGAGTGTICFGWKGGIGTASRRVEAGTIGVLVQSNYGGSLTVAGLPWPSGKVSAARGDGSVMVVIATEIPLEHRELERLAARAMWGLGRTGSSASNGSGDYAIAFSTAREGKPLKGDALSPLFEAVMEATEEAVLNSLFMAETTEGSGVRVEALPAEAVAEEWKKRFPERIVFPAKQPQLATDGGSLVMTYGRGHQLFVRRGSLAQADLGPEILVGERGKLSLGMRRGPRVAMLGQTVLVSAISGELGGGKDGDLWCYRSEDGGARWSEPVRINDVTGSAREGLHAMAAGGGIVYAAWLDLRAKGTRLYGARSKDQGKTWESNELLYQSPEETICQCCHPSLRVDAQGQVWFLFRNALVGNRDMYLGFLGRWGTGKPAKLGEGSWLLNACPMDGGDLALAPDGKPVTVWRRDQEVFSARPGDKEVKLGAGKQPVVAYAGSTMVAAWTEGRTLHYRAGDQQPQVLSTDASFVSLVPATNGKCFVAWESSSQLEWKWV